MADVIDSVNGVISTLQGWSRNNNERVAVRCHECIAALDAAKNEIIGLRLLVSPLPTRLGDLSDIPPSLRAELSGIEVDELEGQLIQVINAYEGTADLNQVLVGLWRKFKVEQTRRFIQQKLWRMTTDHLIWSVPKKKGVYTTTKPSAPEASTAAVSKDDDCGTAHDDFGTPPARAPRPKLVARTTFGDDDEVPF